MKFLILLLLLSTLYTSIICLYSSKKYSLLNGGILLTVFFAFSSNLGINVVIFNKPIYVSLLFFINVTIIWAFFTISVIKKQKNIKLSYTFSYKEKIIKSIILLFLLMIIPLLLQLLYSEIYNYNLFFNNFNLLIDLLLVGIVIYILSKNGLKLKQIIIAIVILSMINSVIGFLQYIFNASFLLFSNKSDIIYTEGRNLTKRAIGIVGASNGAGNLAAIFMPILILYFYKYNKIIGFIAIIFNLIFCILTITRIGYLAILIEVILCFLIIRSKDKLHVALKIFFATFLLVISILMIYFFFDNIFKVLFVDRGDTHLSRFYQFENVKLILSDLPLLGIGAGQYTFSLFANFHIQDIVIHSQLLNVLVEQGIFNFICFITLIVYLTFRGFKQINQKWFIPILLIGFLIVSNFNPNQYYSIPNFIFFIMLYSAVFLED